MSSDTGTSVEKCGSVGFEPGHNDSGIDDAINVSPGREPVAKKTGVAEKVNTREPSLSEPECMHCGDPGVPLIDQGGWYLCKPCARRSERAAAKLADQVRESEFARPVTDRSHKDSETITQPEKIPLGTTASCGIADCSGSHTPQDHNTVMDLVAAHTDTELAELVVGVRGDFEVVMADYQDAARRLVEMQALAELAALAAQRIAGLASRCTSDDIETRGEDCAQCIAEEALR